MQGLVYQRFRLSDQVSALALDIGVNERFPALRVAGTIDPQLQHCVRQWRVTFDTPSRRRSHGTVGHTQPHTVHTLKRAQLRRQLL